MNRHYQKRIEFCKNKMIFDRKNSYLWSQVIEVYLHLLSCEKNHTERITRKEKCLHNFMEK